MNTIAPRIAGLAACLLMLSTAADASTPRRLAVDGRISGEITGADRLNLNDGSRSVGFQVDLRAGQAVAIEASAVFCGRLALFAADDAGRDMVVRDFGSGECSEEGGRKTFAQSLVAPRTARYTLAFSGRGSNDYGPFALSLATIELEADRVLVAGDDVHGLLDVPVKQVDVRITEAGRYVFDLMSSEFDPVLSLNGNGVARENDDGGDSFDSRIVAYLQPGDYRLGVTRLGADGGMYRIRVTRADVELPAGVELQNDGDLAAGGIAGMLEGESNTYRLVVAARSRVDFAVDSTDLDPRITVTGERTALTDDDSGEGTNARLVATLEPGTYTVVVDNAGEVDAGLYTLRTALVASPGAPLRLRPGAPAQGSLVAAEQQHFAFTVDRAGRYVIGLSSTEFDPILHLARDGEILESNDDASDDDTNARLEVDLEPGEYVVIATTYDGGSGRFRLQADRR